MFTPIEDIDALDLERHMNDSASRIEMKSLLQKRFHHIQNILLKTNSLSEKDFEMTVTTLESLMDTLNQKKQNNLSKENSPKTKLTEILQK